MYFHLNAKNKKTMKSIFDNQTREELIKRVNSLTLQNGAQ
jgi:hypothetical protein